MSGYFVDRVQGAGAVAANAPAPRAAPAPSIDRAYGYVPTGAARIDDDGGDSGGGGSAPVPGTSQYAPVRTGTKTPPKKGVPVAPVRGAKPPGRPVPAKTLTAAQVAGRVSQLAVLVPAAAVLPPPLMTGKPATALTPMLSAGGGGGAAAPKGGGAGTIGPIAPGPDDGTTMEATTAVAPPGGATLWLVLGLAGAGYFAYRHFSKRKGRR